MEIFRNVKFKGFEHYRVSNTGKVLNTKRNRYLEGILIPNKLKGYVAQIHLSNKNKVKTIMLHKLVFMHFKEEEIKTNWIWHKDVNGLNNHEQNLELNSHSDYLRKAHVRLNKKRGVYLWSAKGKQIRHRATLKVADKVVTLGYAKEKEDAEILYEFGYEMIYGELPYKIAA